MGLEKYIEIFGREESQINQEAQQRVLFYSGHHFLKNLTHVELDMSEDDYNNAILAGSPNFLEGFGGQFSDIEIRLSKSGLLDNQYIKWIN